MKNIILILIMSISIIGCVAPEKKDGLEWSKLPNIPDKIGFAGSFAGVANGALIVAGGANFPDGGAPWTGSKKAWTDQVFILTAENSNWITSEKLPLKLGYGASVNWKNSLIILGGSNEDGHQKQVYKLNYKEGKLELKNLPDLPNMIANTCAILLNDVLYVMGGITTADAKTTSNNFWALDLSDKNANWQTLPSWPGKSRMLSVAGTDEKAIYLLSGVELINGQRHYLKDGFKYIPQKGWEQIPDLPSAVAAAPSPAYFTANKLMVFGGDDGVLAPKGAELKENHPGFSKQILAYDLLKNNWNNVEAIATNKKEDAAKNPNASIWAPVTTTLTLWNGNIVLPGGEVRPATRTPNVLIAKTAKN